MSLSQFKVSRKSKLVREILSLACIKPSKLYDCIIKIKVIIKEIQDFGCPPIFHFSWEAINCLSRISSLAELAGITKKDEEHGTLSDHPLARIQGEVLSADCRRPLSSKRSFRWKPTPSQPRGANATQTTHVEAHQLPA